VAPLIIQGPSECNNAKGGIHEMTQLDNNATM